MLTHQQHRTDGPPGGPITGGPVVPSHWRNSHQVVPGHWRATGSKQIVARKGYGESSPMRSDY